MPEDTVLPHNEITLPHIFVGDEAYLLTTYLIQPCSRRTLDRSKAIFNYRLSRARRVVECAFGICASKWRILEKAIETKVDTGVEIVKCVSLLHNIIIDFEDYYYLHSRYLSMTPYRCPHTSNQEAADKPAWSLLPARASVLHDHSLHATKRTAPFTYKSLSAQVSGRETRVHAVRWHAGRSLMRWSLKLSELDFLVEHRAGCKIGHVDALSRHLGTITHTSSLEKERILQEQRADAVCRAQRPGNYLSKSEFFLDEDEVLYRRQKSGKHQLMTPPFLVEHFIKESHDPKFVAHPGMKRTYDPISLNSGGRKCAKP
jgi:hypothetical protein